MSEPAAGSVGDPASAGTTFSAAAWSATLPLYRHIVAMPFNTELAAGTLSLPRFQHYIVQDAHYLVAFGQALAVAAAKADEPERIIQFASAAEAAVAVERGLHTEFTEAFGLSAAAVAAIPPAPACHHYAAFLTATSFREPLPVLLAALLPCFWIYREVGRHILDAAAADNPFQAWIETYAGQDFADAVDRMIEATDAVAATASPSIALRMQQAYRRAAQLEWMFWDSAYRLETWPV